LAVVSPVLPSWGFRPARSACAGKTGRVSGW
jgi:hypothetical protein